jgi:hypothetical protein
VHRFAGRLQKLATAYKRNRVVFLHKINFISKQFPHPHFKLLRGSPHNSKTKMLK